MEHSTKKSFKETEQRTLRAQAFEALSTSLKPFNTARERQEPNGTIADINNHSETQRKQEAGLQQTKYISAVNESLLRLKPLLPFKQYIDLLVETGNKLKINGHYNEAIELCFSSCLLEAQTKSESKREEDDYEADTPKKKKETEVNYDDLDEFVLKTKASIGVVECEFNLCHARDPRVLQSSTYKKLLQMITLLQNTIDKVLKFSGNIKTHPESSSISEKTSEEFYWAIFNCTVLLHKICDPLVTLGYSKPILKYIIHGLLAYESITPLCTVSRLSFRVKLYQLCFRCFESMKCNQNVEGEKETISIINAALKLAKRLMHQVCQLQEYEQQDLPIPEVLQQTLDNAKRVAAVHIFKYKTCLYNGPEPLDYIISSSSESFGFFTNKKQQELSNEGPDDQHSSNNFFLEVSLENTCDKYGSLFETTSSKINALRVLLSEPANRQLVHVPNDTKPNFVRMLTWISKACEASSLKILQELEMSKNQPELAISERSKGCLIDLVEISKQLYKYKLYDSFKAGFEAAKCLYQRLSTEGNNLSVCKAELDILSSMHLLNNENVSNSDVDGVETGSEKTLLAQVEGRIISVKAMEQLSMTLKSSIESTSHLTSSRPNFLLDSALHLWSPYCTAMLDTIGAIEDCGKISFDLLKVTRDAVETVYMVLCEVGFDDYILKSTISLRFGHLLAFVTQEHRLAIQILKRGIQDIDMARCFYVSSQVSEKFSLPLCESISTSLETMNIEKTIQKSTSFTNGSYKTLVALHTDMVFTLYNVELAYSASFASSNSNGDTKTGRNKRVSSNKNSNTEAQVPSKYAEMRLMKTCKKNKADRALLLLCIAKHKQDDEEKAKLLSTAASLLDEARLLETKIIHDVLGFNPLSNRSNCEAMDQNKADEITVPACPTLVARSSHEIVLSIRRLHDEATIEGYILYGKPAGSGTDVSSANTYLPGTGVIIPKTTSPLLVSVTGLVKNESYVFAVAAVKRSGHVVGDIGKTTIPIEAINPLPVVQCWSILVKVSIDCCNQPFPSNSNSLSTVKMKDSTKKAYNVLFNYFIEEDNSREAEQICAFNPLNHYTIKKERVRESSGALLQSFVQVLFLDNERKQFQSKSGQSSNQSTAYVPYKNINKVQYGLHISSLKETQKMLIAMDIAVMLNDSLLILEACNRTYRCLLPLLKLKLPDAATLRALVSLKQGFSLVSSNQWCGSSCSVYSSVCYELLRLGNCMRESKAIVKTLFASSTTCEDEITVVKELSQMCENKERESLKMLLCLDSEIAPFGFNIDSIKATAGFKVNTAVRTTKHDVEQEINETAHNDVATDPEANQNFEYNIMNLIAKSKAERKSQYLFEAWEVLQQPGTERYSKYLYLVYLLCNTGKIFPDCPVEKWATSIQEAIRDFEGINMMLPFTKELLKWENDESEEEPFDCKLSLTYPNTEEKDPLELVGVEDFEEGVGTPVANVNADVHGNDQNLVEDGVLFDANAEAKSASSKGESTENNDAVNHEAPQKKYDLYLKKKRWIMFNNINQDVPVEVAKQLQILAGLETICAQKLLREWRYVVAFTDSETNGDVIRDISEVFNEGPGTNMLWRLGKNEESKIESKATILSVQRNGVPPLSIINDKSRSMINEMQSQTRNEKGSILSARLSEADSLREDEASCSASETRSSSAELLTERFQLEALQTVPEILRRSSRAMVRARWAQSWILLEKAGKIFWNTVWYAWISPEQFHWTKEEFSIDADTPTNKSARSRESQEIESQRSARSIGKKSYFTSDDSKSDVGVGFHTHKLYDWRPLWRGTLATLDMLEICRRQYLPNEAEGVTDADSTLNISTKDSSQCSIPIDTLWASKFICYCIQVLSHLNRWPEIKTVGKRFVSLADGILSLALVEPVIPIILYAHQQVLSVAQTELDFETQRLEVLVTEWKEQNSKTKRRKRRTHVKQSSATAVEELTEAERLFLLEKSSLQQTVDAKEERRNILLNDFNESKIHFQNLVKNKNLCRDALDSARNLKSKAILLNCFPQACLEQISFQTQTVKSMLSSRSRKPSVTSHRSKQRSQYSQSSARSTISHRSHISSQSGKSKRSNKVPRDEKEIAAEICIASYLKAIALMREKQETVLLARALTELGDVYITMNSSVNIHVGSEDSQAEQRIRDAARAWSDSVDSITKCVDTIDNWREILMNTIAGESKPVGIVNYDLTANSPEMISQALIEVYGVLGCLISGLSLIKIARFTFVGCYDHERRLEILRMAAVLLSSLIASGLPHPTRYCEFISYKAMELSPEFEVLLFNDPDRVDINEIMEALRYLSNSLCLCPQSRDIILALPILTIYELVATKIAHSGRCEVEARLIKAKVAIKLGFLSEASRIIFDVIDSKCFCRVDKQEMKSKASEFVAKYDRETTNELLDSTEEADDDLIYDDMKLPWESKNIACLEKMEDLEKYKPNKLVEELLGPELVSQLIFCRVTFILRAVEEWKLETDGGNHRDRHLYAVERILETLLQNNGREDMELLCKARFLLMKAAFYKRNFSIVVFLGMLVLKDYQRTGRDSHYHEENENRYSAKTLRTFNISCEHLDFSFWAACRFLISYSLMEQRRLKEAEKHCRLAIQECEKANDLFYKRKQMQIMGIILLLQGDMKPCFSTLQQAIEITTTDTMSACLRLLCFQLDMMLNNKSKKFFKDEISPEENRESNLELIWDILKKDLALLGFEVKDKYSRERNTVKRSLMPQSYYLRMIPELVTASLVLGQKCSNLQKRVVYLKCGLEYISRTPGSNGWLHADLLYNLGKCKAIMLSREDSSIMDDSKEIVEAISTLHEAVLVSALSGGHDYELIHACCLEIFYLYAYRLVPLVALEERKKMISFAAQWLDMGCQVFACRWTFFNALNELSKEATENQATLSEGSTLPEYLKLQMQEEMGKCFEDITVRDILYSFAALQQERKIPVPGSSIARDVTVLHSFLQKFVPVYAARACIKVQNLPRCFNYSISIQKNILADRMNDDEINNESKEQVAEVVTMVQWSQLGNQESPENVWLNCVVENATENEKETVVHRVEFRISVIVQIQRLFSRLRLLITDFEDDLQINSGGSQKNIEEIKETVLFNLANATTLLTTKQAPMAKEYGAYMKDETGLSELKVIISTFEQCFDITRGIKCTGKPLFRYWWTKTLGLLDVCNKNK